MHAAVAKSSPPCRADAHRPGSSHRRASIATTSASRRQSAPADKKRSAQCDPRSRSCPPRARRSTEKSRRTRSYPRPPCRPPQITRRQEAGTTSAVRQRRTSLSQRSLGKGVEPISKSPEEDNEAGELNEAEEVLWMVFPADEDAALPLDPSEEAFDQPAP